MLFPVGVVGLTGINLLRVLVVGVADRQRLPALAALDKPRKQADFPGLAGALPGFQLALHDVKGLAVNKRLMLVLHTTIQSSGFFSPMVPILKRYSFFWEAIAPV